LDSDYIHGLPCSTYQEMIMFYNQKKIQFIFDRSEVYTLSMRLNKLCFLLWCLGPILVIILLLVTSFISNVFWSLITLPIFFLLMFKIDKLKILVIITAIAGFIVLIVNGPIWVAGIALSFLATYIGYYIWWGVAVYLVERRILVDENLFKILWFGRIIAIKDVFGDAFFSDVEIDKSELDEMSRQFLKSLE
jgi:hypothetical protein